MKDWRQLLKRYWPMILAALAAIILLTIVSAPSGGGRLQGSTYSVEPNGYGAWYQMMVDRGVSIERWRQPPTEIADKYPEGTTLLQVNSEIDNLDFSTGQRQWVEEGNTLIVLGVDAPVHDIEFTQDLNSPQGKVRIDTTRRLQENTATAFSKNQIEPIVSDQNGGVVWKAKIGKGKLIVSATPYLAANAYQDFTANYELLAALATDGQQRIVVDEYSHGYRDATPKKTAAAQKNLFTYFSDTPFAIVFLNLYLILGMLIWQQNRRFGAVVIPQPPQVDNSLAYIEALGGVLRQAQTSEFVMQNIGKAEQLKLQQKLGLGNKQLVDRQTLEDTWIAQTKLPATDLPVILQLAPGQKRITEFELQQWLTKLQVMRDQLKRQSL
jgi:Domain of unknown function (DUF4350)